MREEFTKNGPIGWKFAYLFTRYCAPTLVLLGVGWLSYLNKDDSNELLKLLARLGLILVSLVTGSLAILIIMVMFVLCMMKFEEFVEFLKKQAKM